jgi:hypothetical protein
MLYSNNQVVRYIGVGLGTESSLMTKVKEEIVARLKNVLYF